MVFFLLIKGPLLSTSIGVVETTNANFVIAPSKPTDSCSCF